uniref:40S ribosomal protein S15 n=1 Tax=Oncorhynchus tshawytscha TaxID=74940 RepID=A0AAZ3Q9S0_ONCTS
MAEVEIKKKRTFRKFTYRGVDLDQLLDMSYEQLMQLYCARQRRRLNRGLRRKQQSLLKRLRKAKKEAPPMEKPEVVKTHLRDMVILPEMVGSMVGVYNGKTFNQVEIKVRFGGDRWTRILNHGLLLTVVAALCDVLSLPSCPLCCCLCPMFLTCFVLPCCLSSLCCVLSCRDVLSYIFNPIPTGGILVG